MEDDVQKTQDLHVVRIKPLPPPRDIKVEIPATSEANCVVVESRAAIENIIRGVDKRMLAIVGPCSIHCEEEAFDYAQRLSELASKLADRLMVVMRVYFEKPRTTVGWKGLINDPHMDGSGDIAHGLRAARKIAREITHKGLAIGTEALDPLTIRYLSDLLSWVSIGARTAESQLHREMASGLSMPVGFKNTTEGSVQAAIDAVDAARSPHAFLGINDSGQVSEVRTTGNPLGHIILRGGRRGTNYDAQSVQSALEKLTARGLPAALVVDCSHGNSAKEPERQELVLHDIIAQRRQGTTGLVGFMIESNIHAGSQKIPTDLSELAYGVSVTDPCIGWEDTVRMLRSLHNELLA